MKKIVLLGTAMITAFLVNVAFADTSQAQSLATPPTFHVAIALDELGNVIPGAAYEGWHCVTYEGEPAWMCSSLNDYTEFNTGLAETGSAFMDMDVVDSPAMSCDTTSSFYMIRQTAAPAGYTFSDGWNVFCLTTSG